MSAHTITVPEADSHAIAQTVSEGSSRPRKQRNDKRKKRDPLQGETRHFALKVHLEFRRDIAKTLHGHSTSADISRMYGVNKVPVHKALRIYPTKQSAPNSAGMQVDTEDLRTIRIAGMQELHRAWNLPIEEKSQRRQTTSTSSPRCAEDDLMEKPQEFRGDLEEPESSLPGESGSDSSPNEKPHQVTHAPALQEGE